VIDEKLSADGCPRMYFDPGEKTPQMGGKPAEEIEFARPEPVRDSVHPDSMKSGLTEKYFQNTPGSGISLEDRLDVLF
jgi:hypothetical protein